MHRWRRLFQSCENYFLRYWGVERVLRASCSVLRGTIETVSSVAIETRDVISQYPRKAAGAWCRRGGGHFLGTGQELWSGVDLRRGNESN